MLDSAIFAATLILRPSFLHSLPAAIASRKPPSLISFSDTPFAPARFTASMSASEWMPSSMPIGVFAGARERFQSGEIVGRQRLLDKRQVHVTCPLGVAARCRQCQTAIGIGAKRGVGKRSRGWRAPPRFRSEAASRRS